MNWLYIVVAGIFEIGFTFCMGKAREGGGTSAVYWWAAFVACMVCSLLLMFRAISGPGAIPVGTAYAVWTGIGAGGAVLMGMIFFHEPADFWRLFFVSTLIGSIIGLKVVSH